MLQEVVRSGQNVINILLHLIDSGTRGGMKYHEIAEIIECSMNTINHVLNKRKWKHIWSKT